jgi:hypothetical protein
MPGKNIWEILNRNLFFVKNAVSMREAKTQDKLDVYDPESHEVLLECREPDIGLLTKMARLCGGRNDKGTAFNLVASIPGSNERVLRIARGNATLSFGGPVVKISDDQFSLIGKLKRKNFSLGEKFDFTPENQGESFILQCKSGEIFCNDKKVAAFLKWNSNFFIENKFGYAFSISPEVPASSQMRQVLLAFGMAQHRIIIKTTIII